MKPLSATVAVVAALLVLAGCAGEKGEAPSSGYVTDVAGPAAGGEGSRSTLNVAAAANLRLALEELRPALEQACGARITATYGASGQFANQIAAGAPFDLFLSADARYTDDLAARGLVAPGGMARYARGRIALAVRPGLPLPNDVGAVNDPQYAKIAIANPELAPYGRAAEEALKAAGIYDAIKGRLVLAENVRQSVDYVDGGNADAGIVALALVVDHPPERYRPIEPTLHGPIDQTGAVIAGRGGERTARCVLQALLEEPAQGVLRSYGYDPPGEP